MKILVAGAFGFLGLRLCEALRARDHEVVASGRRVPRGSAEWAAQFEIRTADVLDARDCAEVVRGADAVVDLASIDEVRAVQDPDLAVRVSSEGCRKLVAASLEADVRRFVFLSTFHVYGSGVSSRIDEETPCRPSHPYSIAHFAGEGWCLEANRMQQEMRCVALRMTNGYGLPTTRASGRWGLAHLDFCSQAVATRRIVLRSPGAQHRDWVWLDDVAQAVDLAVSAPSAGISEIMNVGGALSMSIFDLARLVESRSRRQGLDVRIEAPAPQGDAPPPLDVRVDRLRALGYVPSNRLVEETDAILAMLAQSTKSG